MRLGADNARDELIEYRECLTLIKKYGYFCLADHCAQNLDFRAAILQKSRHQVESFLNSLDTADQSYLIVHCFNSFGLPYTETLIAGMEKERVDSIFGRDFRWLTDTVLRILSAEASEEEIAEWLIKAIDEHLESRDLQFSDLRIDHENTCVPAFLIESARKYTDKDTIMIALKIMQHYGVNQLQEVDLLRRVVVNATNVKKDAIIYLRVIPDLPNILSKRAINLLF